jgi:predicted HicB family RNase H-like nuclease
MAKTAAQVRATRKYDEKAYDRIELKVPKGNKDRYKAIALANGESLNGLINRLLEEEANRVAQQAYNNERVTSD